MLIRLYLLLVAFLTLGVDPPDEPDPADPPDDPDLPDLNADDPDPDGNTDPDPDAPDPDDPDTLREQLKTERTARETAQREAREASERLAAADRARTAAPPPPSQEQRLFDEEEARLRDPKVTALEKWQIESNRAMRAQARTANQALMESREIADRTDWDNLKRSNPVLKKYEDRVEKKLAEIRSTGSTLPRKVVAQLLIGEDIVSGKVKSTKRAAPTDTTTTSQPRTVDRGKPPSARSDVRSRGGQTEHDKRRARLENQII